MKKTILFLVIFFGFAGPVFSWSCPPKTYSMGMQECRPMPSNAHLVHYGTNWECNDGYVRNGYICSRGYKITIPPNAHKFGNSWQCNSGFTQNKDRCVLKASNSKDNNQDIPRNAYASGSGWKCNPGFVKYGNTCLYKADDSEYENVPPNAIAWGSGWKCISGYIKRGNGCVLGSNIPPNAYASGSGWECNPGFEKQGNSCKEIEDDTIYKAGSGTGFAATEDGHILTNHHVIDGCTEVALFNKGESYITTVITQDPNNDLAILKSDFKPTKVYPLTTEVYLSDDIFAAGYPFGKKISSAITINKGIISALMGPGDDISIFQIDADINSGNSGGPIVDRRGNAVGIAVAKLNAERAQEELKLGSTPEGFNFAVNSMMAIGLFRSQGINLPPQNNNELSVKERNDLFNQGTFYLSCGMTIAQYEKMIKTDKVMFTRDVFFSNFEGN